MDAFPQDYEVFDLGDFTLQHGATLREAKLAYKTYGELNADRSNAIVYPTWYSGRHWDNEWLIGAGMALDPIARATKQLVGEGVTTEAEVAAWTEALRRELDEVVAEAKASPFPATEDLLVGTY